MRDRTKKEMRKRDECTYELCFASLAGCCVGWAQVNATRTIGILAGVLAFFPVGILVSLVR